MDSHSFGCSVLEVEESAVASLLVARFLELIRSALAKRTLVRSAVGGTYGARFGGDDLAGAWAAGAIWAAAEFGAGRNSGLCPPDAGGGDCEGD
jgi:hypothetical protein